MQDRIPEALLQRLLYEFLCGRGCRARTEVFLAGKRFDVVTWEVGELLGYEVKISDWRKAISQLRIYQLFCHRVFLVKWGMISEKMLRECREEGIGVLSIGRAPDFELQELAPALTSVRRKAAFTAALINAMQGEP